MTVQILVVVAQITDSSNNPSRRDLVTLIPIRIPLQPMHSQIMPMLMTSHLCTTTSSKTVVRAGKAARTTMPTTSMEPTAIATTTLPATLAAKSMTPRPSSKISQTQTTSISILTREVEDSRCGSMGRSKEAVAVIGSSKIRFNSKRRTE